MPRAARSAQALGSVVADVVVRYRNLWAVSRVGRVSRWLFVAVILTGLILDWAFGWKPPKLVVLVTLGLFGLAAIEYAIGFRLGIGKPRCPYCGGFINYGGGVPRYCASCEIDLVRLTTPPNNSLERSRDR